MDEAVLKVSGKMLQTIYFALDEVPGRVSREVYNEISRQVAAQLKEHDDRKRQEIIDSVKADGPK